MEKCVACEWKLARLGKRSSFAVYRCLRCGLGKTVGGRSCKQYQEYHRDYVYQISQNQFKNIFAKRVSLISKYAKTGKALEVGSSTGLLLSLLKDRGWDVTGVESSKNATALAKSRGVTTINTTFEKAKLLNDFYDLVIFNHVLEHMVDPHAVLQKTRAILKKGGILFLDVPNFASLSAKLYGVGWKYILPQEHKWHFTKNSLERILAKTGFKLVYWEARSGIWDYSNPWLEIWQSLISLKKRFIFNIITAIPSLIITFLNQGSGLTIIAIAKQ